MAFIYNILKENEFLLVTSHGELSSYEKTIDYALDILDRCRRESMKLVLLDERNLDHDLSVLDALRVARKIAQLFQEFGHIKIAQVLSKDDRSKMASFETFAYNRGIDLKQFDTIVEAESWLFKY